MKFFNWMQSKMNRGQGDKRPNSVPATNHAKKEPSKEEFGDLPHGLFAIGTFGTAGIGDSKLEMQIVEANSNCQIPQAEQCKCSSPDFSEFTAEEVGKLQKVLTNLLVRKPAASEADQEQPPVPDLPLDRFLNCPSSLKVDSTSSDRFSNYSENNDEEEIDRTIRIILGRCKDVCEEKKKNKKKKTNDKKSLSFLVKKMFACRSGFATTSSIHDMLQESKMEKLMRIMLTKKINPQPCSRSPSTKKYIEEYQPKSEEDNVQESHHKSGERSKWDKTDSEFIVLEI